MWLRKGEWNEEGEWIGEFLVVIGMEMILMRWKGICEDKKKEEGNKINWILKIWLIWINEYRWRKRNNIKRMKK